MVVGTFALPLPTIHETRRRVVRDNAFDVIDTPTRAQFHVRTMRTFTISPVAPCQDAYECTPAERFLDLTEHAIASACNTPACVTHAPKMHPLLTAVGLAYAYHYPLTLASDDVWLCLVQGLAQHVQENAEALRNRFVHHEGKKTIRIEVEEGPAKDAAAWRSVINAFTQGVAEEIGKKRDLFIADFSTTGEVERTAFEIALLDTVQHYFGYELIVICGIPSITLLGTPDDWRDLRNRAAVLAEFDLEEWTAVVLEILDQFVAASEGNVNVEFWGAIYEQTSLNSSGIMECGDGGTMVTGWLNALLSTLCTAPLETWMQHEMGNRHASFTSGLSIAPFIVTYRRQESAIEFVAGFVGINQDPTTLALRPSIGWLVREKRKRVEDAFGDPICDSLEDVDPYPPPPKRNGPMAAPKPSPNKAENVFHPMFDSDATTHFELAIAYLEMGMILDAIDELDVIASHAPQICGGSTREKRRGAYRHMGSTRLGTWAQPG